MIEQNFFQMKRNRFQNIFAFLFCSLLIGLTGFYYWSVYHSPKKEPIILTLGEPVKPEGEIDYSFQAESVVYPELFETSEVMGRDIRPFVKWTEMVSRFNQQVSGINPTDEQQNPDVDIDIQPYIKIHEELEKYRGMPPYEMADHVNRLINKVPYVMDSISASQEDFWYTPVEFYQQNKGDCEDYAIAKLEALHYLGVSEKDMRIAIVRDHSLGGIIHSLLIYYVGHEVYILDNQSSDVISGAEKMTKYNPIFSINNYGWWRHMPSHNPL